MVILTETKFRKVRRIIYLYWRMDNTPIMHHHPMTIVVAKLKLP